MSGFQPLEEMLLFRPVSRRLAGMLARVGVHPNQVSVFGLAVAGAVSALTFLYYNGNGLTGRLLVGFAYYIAFVTDKIDGDLARVRGIASNRGAYLDSFVDRLGEVLILAAVGITVGFPHPLLVLLGTSGILLHYAHLYMFWHYTGETSFFPTTSLRKRTLRNLLAYNRAKHFLLLAVLAATGMLHLTFWFLVLLIPYTILVFLVLFLRDHRLRNSTHQP